MGIKSTIKRITPKPLLPLAHKINNLIGPHQQPYKVLSRSQLDKLPALKARISYNEYGGYCVPESSIHRPAADLVMRAAVYEPKTIEFMREHCAGGDIVHAGTYFGDFLPALAGAVGETGRIWAFEPNRENYRCAAITCMLNELDNVVLRNAGLGDASVKAVMRTKDELGRGLGGASKIVTTDSASPSNSEEVEIVTIDSVLPKDRSISIVQLDVEGHERAALSGALQTIQRCKPIIILEDLDTSSLLDSDWFRENILSLGYCLSGEVHGNKIYSIAGA